ncbi:MAG TPA: hypothetical protein ENI05_09335, partial [Porticoccus sp.]|nr:hypothetical protein [Porticoccus sp.]
MTIKEIVDLQCLNATPVAAMTFDQSLPLRKDRRGKDGRIIAGERTWKASRFAESAELLFVDLDKSEELVGKSVNEIVAQIEQGSELRVAAMYPSSGYTPAAPRYHVIFIASRPMNSGTHTKNKGPEEFKAVAEHVARELAKIGLTADPSMGNPSQACAGTMFRHPEMLGHNPFDDGLVYIGENKEPVGFLPPRPLSIDVGTVWFLFNKARIEIELAGLKKKEARRAKRSELAQAAESLGVENYFDYGAENKWGVPELLVEKVEETFYDLIGVGPGEYHQCPFEDHSDDRPTAIYFEESGTEFCHKCRGNGKGRGGNYYTRSIAKLVGIDYQLELTKYYTVKNLYESEIKSAATKAVQNATIAYLEDESEEAEAKLHAARATLNKIAPELDPNAWMSGLDKMPNHFTPDIEVEEEWVSAFLCKVGLDKDMAYCSALGSGKTWAMIQRANDIAAAENIDDPRKLKIFYITVLNVLTDGNIKKFGKWGMERLTWLNREGFNGSGASTVAGITKLPPYYKADILIIDEALS